MPPLDAVAAFTLALVVLSAVNAAVTTILTSSSLFDPLRVFMARLSPTLGEFVTCDLCAGTWIGAGIAAVAVWWLGWTGIDALLAGAVITFATLAGAAIWREAGNLY